MFKRILLVALSVLFALSVFGCAKPAAAPESTADVPAPVSVDTQVPEATAAMEAESEGLGIVILKEQDDSMINNYTVIAVNEAAPFKDADGKAVSGVAINTVGAKALIDWLMSQEAADLIAQYAVEE